MDNKEYLNIFRKTGALMEGHFVLTSGRHSRSYFQCAKVLQYPQYLNLFSKIISDHFKTFDVNTVISPAVGGIVIGTRVGGDLDKKTIFAERENGEMVLRRGFSISPGEKVLVVEDVITTGSSVIDCAAKLEQHGVKIVKLISIVSRYTAVVSLCPYYRKKHPIESLIQIPEILQLGLLIFARGKTN